MRLVLTPQVILHFAVVNPAFATLQRLKSKQRGEIGQTPCFAGLDEEVAGLKQENAGLNTELAALNATVAALQQENAGLNTELADLKQLVADVIANITSVDDDTSGIDLAKCTWTCDGTTLTTGASGSGNVQCDATNSEVVMDHYCSTTIDVTVSSVLLTDPSGKLPSMPDSIGHATQLECRFDAVADGNGTSCIRCCAGVEFDVDPCSSNPCDAEETCANTGSYGAYLCLQPIANNTELKDALEDYLGCDEAKETAVIEKYGPIGLWDVSQVTDFSSVFAGRGTFNEDISNWNVSNGMSFSGMFNFAEAFNQPLENWDVSSGTVFSSMFSVANAFNQPLEKWDVSSGTRFSAMFESIPAFNQPLGNWDVSSGINFDTMFFAASAFDQNLCSWSIKPTASVTIMFSGSGCPNGSDPVVSASPISPLCQACSS